MYVRLAVQLFLHRSFHHKPQVTTREPGASSFYDWWSKSWPGLCPPSCCPSRRVRVGSGCPQRTPHPIYSVITHVPEKYFVEYVLGFIRYWNVNTVILNYQIGFNDSKKNYTYSRQGQALTWLTQNVWPWSYKNPRKGLSALGPNPLFFWGGGELLFDSGVCWERDLNLDQGLTFEEDPILSSVFNSNPLLL